MKPTKRRPSLLLNLILFLGLVAIWIAFAPAKLGGQASYVMVHGSSMEPGYHTGDLVILRRAQTYLVGDVVTYRDPKFGAYVIHRIIGMDGERFVLQGDNNSWIDAYHPAAEEVFGKKWIHAPKLGRGMEWFRKPINLVLTIALLGGVFMTSMISRSPKAQRGKSRPALKLGGIFEGTLYLLGSLFLAFIVLSIFAFTRPVSRSADGIPYVQESNYFYSAAGTPGVYDTDTVRTGEPVFPALTCFLNIGHTYNIQGAGLQDVSGSHQMYARIMDEPSGWQRTIPLIPQTAFNGTSHFSMVSLDLCELTTLVNMVETETGLRTNTYTVEIVSNIAFTANAAGQAHTDTLDPILAFKFDKVHFWLAAEGEVDPLHISKDGLAVVSGYQPNTFSLLGWEATVRSVRVISLIGLGLSLTALTAAAWVLYRTVHSSQDTLIRLKYGGLLMDVYENMVETTSTNIDVASIDDLARLAERQNTMIQHLTRNFLHYYLVQGNGVTYRYVISSGQKGLMEVEPTQEDIRTDGASLPAYQEPAETPVQAAQDGMFRYMVSAQQTSIARRGSNEPEILRRIII
jgi:signal peptidase I